VGKDKIQSDEYTLYDKIEHAPHVKNVGDMVCDCRPPYVIGIHGNWGAGKTSFLRKIHLYLSGDRNEHEDAEGLCKELWTDNYKRPDNIETIWFDAWRYQFETNPVVPLLNEIRAHFTMSQKFAGKTAKLGYSAIMALDGLGKLIGVSPKNIAAAGEKWEKEHFTQPIPSQMFKELLEEAIDKFLGGSNHRKRLVIFVDDLDRCMGQVAFRFLEAMKIYLSLSNCVFVLGVDIRHIRKAVAIELLKGGVIKDAHEKSSELYANDYLGKMFQHIFYLPNPLNYKEYLDFLIKDEVLADKEKWIEIIANPDYKLLPPNPRKIKSYVNGLIFYAEQLQSILEVDKTDRMLTLIFNYLRLMANDIYRILEAEPDFWTKLTEFCRTGKHNGHWALEGFILPEEAMEGKGETGYEYESVYPDPADERLFRAAGLIRKWDEKNFGARPGDSDFDIYMRLQKPSG